jgi:hypothetical protein
VKITLEIPDAVFRRAKQMADGRGVSLRELVIEAVKDKPATATKRAENPWVKHVGKLKHLRQETAWINRTIAEASEGIEKEMWR